MFALTPRAGRLLVAAGLRIVGSPVIAAIIEPPCRGWPGCWASTAAGGRPPPSGVSKSKASAPPRTRRLIITSPPSQPSVAPEAIRDLGQAAQAELRVGHQPLHLGLGLVQQ